MIIISHRGNLSGSDNNRENKLFAIEECIGAGFHVEVDLWYKAGAFFLGHDHPKSFVPISKLLEHSEKLWCHAKNIEALIKLKTMEMNCFWHQTDEYTLTSKGYIWTYPNLRISSGDVVIVDKDLTNSNLITKAVIGVCTDRPMELI